MSEGSYDFPRALAMLITEEEQVFNERFTENQMQILKTMFGYPRSKGTTELIKILPQPIREEIMEHIKEE